MAINTLLIIQARMSSSRLPAKVLKTILDKPLLTLQYERLQRCQNVDKIVIATSTNQSDDVLAHFCSQQQMTYYRGRLHDVLDRYYHTAKYYQAQHIIRITADCPLIDPHVVDTMIQLHLSIPDADYTSNVIERSFPDGLDTEVFTWEALQTAWKKAHTKEQREHVTPYIYQHPEIFTLQHYQQANNYSHFRWTVDTPKDFAFIKEVYTALYPHNPSFTTQDIMQWLQREDKYHV